MRKEPSRLGGMSLDFAGIPPWWFEDFPDEHAQVVEPYKISSVFFNAHLYVLLWNISRIQFQHGHELRRIRPLPLNDH